MKHFFIFSLFLFIGTLFFGATAQSLPLDPPGSVSCSFEANDGGVCGVADYYLVSWEEIAGATKYAVSIECESQDMATSQEVSIGTSECEDPEVLGCMDATDTQICIDSLDFTLPESDWTCTAKVRGLHPPTRGRPATRGSKRQNSPNNGGGNHQQATDDCPTTNFPEPPPEP